MDVASHMNCDDPAFYRGRDLNAFSRDHSQPIRGLQIELRNLSSDASDDGDACSVNSSSQLLEQSLASSPREVICQACKCRVMTKVEDKPMTTRHAFKLCVARCWPCVPNCRDSCQKKEHYCPNCGAYLFTISNIKEQ